MKGQIKFDSTELLNANFVERKPIMKNIYKS